MQVFSRLVGILLACLSVASAIPTPTPTTCEDATRVTLGPRRNGFSDLPSAAWLYNAMHQDNRIPDYVMANDPATGFDSIIYTRDEIYTAMQQGYEVLQRSRDPDGQGFGELIGYGKYVATYLSTRREFREGADNPSIVFPAYVRHDEEDLDGTHYGIHGDDLVDMYSWPLLWTNGWTGFNQNPGQDRVVFDRNGTYIGVITWRYSESQPGLGCRWCPPTDGYGRWIARWIGGQQGWDYPGVPPNGPNSYTSPSNWNIAESQRMTWWDMNPGGMPPTGSHGLQVNSSSPPPPVDMTPPGASFDDGNPLQFPPWDNSTGTLQHYVPGNLDVNVTRKGEAPDCVFARNHGAGGYHQSCQTYPHKGNSMQVRITVSGTGQDNRGWCQGIIDNMKGSCGGNFNLLGNIYSCDKAYPGTVTFSKATDPSDPGHGKYYFGIDLHFYLQWPWAESDADHRCMSEAVEKGSCGRSNVKSVNGKWCRAIAWKPDPPLVEWSSDMGPP